MTETADHGAGHRAHAAEHDDGEGDEDIGFAGARLHVVARQQHAGGDGEARGAEAEGDGVDMRDVDADQRRAELLLGDRADRLAGVGLLQQRPQQQRDERWPRRRR